jgi:hypothetical protein
MKFFLIIDTGVSELILTSKPVPTNEQKWLVTDRLLQRRISLSRARTLLKDPSKP